MSKVEDLQQDLLSRVQAIGTPLAEALRERAFDAVPGTDVDGHCAPAPVDREIVAMAMRRLLALCVDIEEGLYKAELGDA